VQQIFQMMGLNMTVDLKIPERHAICPLCKGTGLGTELTVQQLKRWPYLTHFKCGNCGGRTISGVAIGYTRMDPLTRRGCLHTFTEGSSIDGIVIFNCTRCNYSYEGYTDA
jgi:hypothetical protein